MRVWRPALQVCQGSWQQRVQAHIRSLRLTPLLWVCASMRFCKSLRGLVYSNPLVILVLLIGLFLSDLIVLVSSWHHSTAVCWQLLSFSSLSGAAVSVTSDWVRQIMWFASNFKGRSQTNVTPERVFSSPVEFILIINQAEEADRKQAHRLARLRWRHFAQ